MNNCVTAGLTLQGSQFCLSEVEVVTATVDLEDVRSFRGASLSRGMQAMMAEPYPRCYVDSALSHPSHLTTPCSQPIPVRYYMPEEEIR